MDLFDVTKNNIFVGQTDKLQEWHSNDSDQGKTVERIRLMLKHYLELDNVSFLFGSGTSIHLGAVAIRNFPVEIEKHIYEKCTDLFSLFIETVKSLQKSSIEQIEDWELLDPVHSIKRIKSSLEIAVEFESLLNFLISKSYILEQEFGESRDDKVDELIRVIKEGLFKVCDVEKRDVPQWLIDNKKNSENEQQNNQGKLLENESKYIFHEKFLKTLLQRPLNLRRANIFTANYDLSFEYTFDRLGIHYIDGFSGFHRRCFKPETFEYDIFYPGSTTAGKVQRIEKVVRYYKLHGSLSWVNSETRDASNIYGIEELPLGLIDQKQKKGEIIVYPTAVKKSYTLDLPYSELFRQFSSTINQSQSVLFTLGYAFADEHFNDIIFQALSSPSFTLVIVDFNGTDGNPHIERIKNLNDSRIIILQGEFFGDFLTFADTLMPDFYNIDSNEKIASTLNKYFESNTEDKPKPIDLEGLF